MSVGEAEAPRARLCWLFFCAQGAHRSAACSTWQNTRTAGWSPPAKPTGGCQGAQRQRRVRARQEEDPGYDSDFMRTNSQMF